MMLGERTRFWLPVALLVLFAGYVAQKLVRAHVDPQVSSIDYSFTKPLPACRGAIYDAAGNPLAKSIPVWEYHLDAKDLTNGVVRRKGEPPRPRNAIVKTIATSLGLDYRQVLAMADRSGKGSSYQYLATSSDARAHGILANSRLVRGVAIDERHVRQYLYGRLLSHVIGSVNAEHVGSAGIELKYNREMTGTPGQVKGKKDATRHELYDKRIVCVEPVPGADVHLTVDRNLQFEAEAAVRNGVREFGAGAGWSVILDAKTAAVLAMASCPDFDPLRFGSTKDSAKLNRVTAFTYEPGSVMKVITAAAAFDCGYCGPNRMYNTNRSDERYYRLPGDGSHKWEPTMSVAEAIVHSSNIVIGKLGCDLGPKRLYAYMRRFGFGQRTGIELPGEEVGILPDPNRRMWDKASWSRAAIGQFVSVTAIQLASAYQTIANDGVRMLPYIVSRVSDRDGIDLYRREPKCAGRVISASAARQLREVMRGVASPKGTARRAALKGYSVAGKTGTAQKVIRGHYAPGLYRATFIGMVPAAEPRLVILVTLDFDEAGRKFHQGGNSSGPVFRRLATAALRYLRLPPDQPDDLPDEEDEDELDKIMDDRARSAGAKEPLL